jgi:bifunctional DNA-binding transcriptional regulator/antitoxin component of YhaV-PrlF toxin-antitoxin module
MENMVNMENKEKARYRVIKTVAYSSYNRRGSSIRVTVPPEIKEFLGLKEKGKLAFVKDEKENCIIILDASKIRVAMPDFDEGSLGFSVPEEVAKKILKKS